MVTTSRRCIHTYGEQVTAHSLSQTYGSPFGPLWLWQRRIARSLLLPSWTNVYGKSRINLFASARFAAVPITRGTASSLGPLLLPLGLPRPVRAAGVLGCDCWLPKPSTLSSGKSSAFSFGENPSIYLCGRPRLPDIKATSLARYKTPRAMTRASIATNEPQTPMPKKWPYKPDERRVLDITRTGETRTDRRRAPPRADASRRSARCRSGRAPGPEGPPSRGSPPAPGRSRGSSWS